MPAKFKRAYCTYSFYKDAAFTQPVTEADFKNGLKIYVDYVFDPPFEISSEGDEWYYFLTTYENNYGFEWLKGQVSISGQVDTNYEKGTSTPGNNEIQKGYFSGLSSVTRMLCKSKTGIMGSISILTHQESV